MTAVPAVSRPSARGALAAPPRRKPTVGFGDLVALTVRQHRLAIGLSVLGYVLFGLLIVLSHGHVAFGHWWTFDPKVFTPVPAGLIAVFLGAPLLAGEYERQTNLLVWSQDVTPLRWLLAKLTVLGGLVMVLATLLAIVVNTQTPNGYGGSNYGAFNPLAMFHIVGYETWLPLSLAYAVFGFLLGVAVGGLARRTVTAMGITLVGFVAIRFLIANLLWPWLLAHLIAPIRVTWPIADWITPNPNSASGAGPLDYVLNNQLWLTASGQSVDVPPACYSVQDIKPFGECLIRNGVASSGEAFQPLSRLLAFESVELASYVVLIAICLAITIWSVRRKVSI
ncbi:MAG TPA: hypothetical protein VGJ45_28975 [Pseudonocardiaceae bacterium]|jgi:ABC-type transport system involved in multi-copper enzyme maturation permease subunit